MTLLLIITFCFGFILSLVLIPVIIRISFKKGYFDKPNERKVHHSKHIPRMGGICFFPITALVFAIILTIGFRMAEHWIVDIFNLHMPHFLYGAASAFVLFCMGALDDIWGVRYRTKFIGQIVAGVLLCMSGLWIYNLHGILGIYRISAVFGFPITIFAIVFITNAINFIDGIDGLASSISLIALLYYTFTFIYLGIYDFAILSVAVAGPIVGFMLYNLFGKPEKKTKVFMGDTGSLFLGFVLSVLGIALNRFSGNNAMFNPMTLGFAPMILPCFDVVRVVLVRIREGHNPFIADKNHIHHKFMSIGLSQHTVLIIVDLLTILFAGLAIILSHYVDVNLTLILLFLIWVVMNFILPNHFNDNKEKIRI